MALTQSSWAKRALPSSPSEYAAVVNATRAPVAPSRRTASRNESRYQPSNSAVHGWSQRPSRSYQPSPKSPSTKSTTSGWKRATSTSQYVVQSRTLYGRTCRFSSAARDTPGGKMHDATAPLRTATGGSTDRALNPSARRKPTELPTTSIRCALGRAVAATAAASSWRAPAAAAGALKPVVVVTRAMTTATATAGVTRRNVTAENAPLRIGCSTTT